MTEVTPELNQLRLTELKGRMDTFEATISGQINIQTQSIKQISLASDSIKDAVNKVATHCENMVRHQESHERDIGAIKVKIKGHEELCEERDKKIEDKITTGFTTIRDTMELTLSAKEEKYKAVQEAEDKAGAKVDESKRWRYGTYVTIIIAVFGWIIAIFS